MPCIMFTGHPSLRMGDVVHFMENWSQNPANCIIFTGNYHLYRYISHSQVHGGDSYSIIAGMYHLHRYMVVGNYLIFTGTYHLHIYVIFKGTYHFHRYRMGNKYRYVPLE